MGGRRRWAWVAAVTPVALGGWAAPAGAFVYWANFNANTIGRANLDGSDANQGFIGGASLPSGVAVDGRHVYGTNTDANTVGRANLDGSGANQSFITGASGPRGIAVDRWRAWSASVGQ